MPRTAITRRLVPTATSAGHTGAFRFAAPFLPFLPLCVVDGRALYFSVPLLMFFALRAATVDGCGSHASTSACKMSGIKLSALSTCVELDMRMSYTMHTLE